jgi:regulatory protein
MPLVRSPGQGRSLPATVTDPDDDDAGAAAVRILASADRSQIEVRRLLERRGFSRAAAEAAVQRLAGRGWIDDERLASRLSDRRLERGYGRRRVVADLVARGVAAETVSRVSDALVAQQAEVAALAARRLRRRFPEGRLDERDLRRLGLALERRGFEAGAIRAALRAVDDDDSLGP